MRTDFAAFILTHGRPENVKTYRTLRSGGYTGRIVLIVDDQDESLREYQDRFGEDVFTFSKSEIAKEFDEFDNFTKRNTVVYARNIAFRAAVEMRRKDSGWFEDST